MIKKLFCLILQVHVTKIGLLEFKSAIAVTRDGLEELKKNVGQYVVELEIILWRLCFVFLPFFFSCPCSLLNKYYHFAHGFFLGLISEE